ncbi:MAG: sulfotransferase [Phycisphaerales bacterium]|nr:sulfotransferase [Phycisphaerales bacterium]
MSGATNKLGRILDQANAALERESLGSAIMLYRKALGMDKNNPKIMLRLGQVLLSAGFVDEAIDIIRKSAKKRANHPDTMVILAQAYLTKGDIPAMHAALEKALTQQPDHGAAILAMVKSHIDSGSVELAQEFLERMGDAGKHDALALMARAMVERELKHYEPAAQYLKQVLEGEDFLERHKRSARFELGAVYDGLKDYDTAFEYYQQANSGHIQGNVAHVPSIQSAWSKEVLNAIPASTIHDERPVIIAGMPRSGTTLTERILQAHPFGGSVGECPLLLQMVSRTLASNLDQERIDSYASEYLGHLDTQVGSAAARVIDKHMGTEKSLGLISKVLPKVRVIHALRDPRDCCLSAYFQNFGTNVPYSRDLSQLGQQYAAHRAMMDYWKEILEIPVFTNIYEEFVIEPERHTRALIEFLGLEFDNACLKFYESKDHVHTASATQVRKPVYQSGRQRWKNYEQHLGPLLEALGPYADGVHAQQSLPSEAGIQDQGSESP